MRPYDLPPELGSGPFTVASARAAGVSRATLRSRRFLSPHHGLRTSTGTPNDLRAAVEAARLVLPSDALATGVTGLRVLGVDVGTPASLQFVTAHPRQVRRPGLRVTRVTRLPPMWAWDDEVAIPEHCWMTAALELDRLELVTAGDWLLRLRVTNQNQLAAYVRASSSRGCRPAREAVDLVRERVDSPRESWLRLCLALAGLPTPDGNPTVRGRTLKARVDLVYQQFRILIEYEGDQHRVDKNQWNVDIDRQEDFLAGGWTVYRVTAARARHPRRIVERVHGMLVEAGYDGPAPVFDARWRNLFD